MSSLAVAPGPADWRGRTPQELEGEAWNDTSEKLGWFGPSLRPRSKTLDTAWRARTDTQDTCLQRRYILTRTSTRFIFLRTCAQQTRATWDPLKAGGCVFLRRTDDGSAHHTQHVLLQTAVRRTLTHINTHTTRLQGMKGMVVANSSLSPILTNQDL